MNPEINTEQIHQEVLSAEEQSVDTIYRWCIITNGTLIQDSFKSWFSEEEDIG